MFAHPVLSKHKDLSNKGTRVSNWVHIISLLLLMLINELDVDKPTYVTI